MFHKLFNPENGLWITVSQITDCIFLSLFFLVGCVPLITIGASMSALYDAVYHGFRRGDKHCWQRFFRSWWQNLKPSFFPLICYAGVFWAGSRVLIGLWNDLAAGQGSWALFSGAMLLGVLVLGIESVLFPMLSRFENPTGILLKNTVLLAMANLPRTLVLGMVNAGVLYLCLKFILPMTFLPALSALISTWLLEPMFRPYLPEEEAEPLES